MPGQHRKHSAALLRGLFATAAVTVGASIAAPASAQALDERLWLELSGFYPRIDTVLTLSRPGQPGTPINLEEDLALDESQALPAFNAGWRIGDRWVLQGEFYALDRAGSQSIGRDIVFDGATFPIGVTVDSKMRSDVYRVTLGYSFIKNDRSELGAAIGLHATDFELELNGQAQIGPGVRQFVARRRDVVAPMPTLGVYGTYEATPKVVLNGRVDYLSLDVGDYGGGITNAQLSAAYRFTPAFSGGLAYRYVAYDLDIEKTEYTADIDYDFSGPSIFLRYSFR